MKDQNKLVQWRALNIRVNRTKQNFNKGKYAPLEEILDKINAPLSEIGLILKHTLVKVDNEQNYHLCSVLLDGEVELNSTCFPVLGHADPQKVAAGITYARRYNISVLLDIAADDDDDGETASRVSRRENSVRKITKAAPRPDRVSEAQFKKLLEKLDDEKTDKLNIAKWVMERVKENAFEDEQLSTLEEKGFLQLSDH